MNFHDDLKICIHKYIKFIYGVTKNFPREELYGVISQFRRAGMSIMLNYVEGFARKNKIKNKLYINFLETSYGSLKETKYLLYFSYDIGYITKENYKYGFELADRIGAMLWSLIRQP
jgi:four helix bundle protein